MPHAIDSVDIERLSRLTGVSSFDDWKRQLEDQASQIRERLDGSVADAWVKCLPVWLELGRVRDLSLALRVPKYWPSFANNLGIAFAEQYRDDVPFLIDILESSPVDSHEYLFAVDLLDFVASDAEPTTTAMLEQLMSVGNFLPPVIRLEIELDKRYDDVETIGDFLRRRHEIESGNVA